MRTPLTRATARALRADRRALAAELECADTSLRRTLLEHACIDTGGTVIPNDRPGRWGPLEAQISLMGISATGLDLDAAIAQWIKCAIRTERALCEAEHAARTSPA